MTDTTTEYGKIIQAYQQGTLTRADLDQLHPFVVLQVVPVLISSSHIDLFSLFVDMVFSWTEKENDPNRTIEAIPALKSWARYCAQDGWAEGVQYLLDRCTAADMCVWVSSDQAPSKESPLIQASRAGHSHVVQLLIDGADPKHVLLAAAAAVQRNQLGVVRFLWDQMVDHIPNQSQEEQEIFNLLPFNGPFDPAADTMFDLLFTKINPLYSLPLTLDKHEWDNPKEASLSANAWARIDHMWCAVKPEHVTPDLSQKYLMLNNFFNHPYVLARAPKTAARQQKIHLQEQLQADAGQLTKIEQPPRHPKM